MRFLRLAEVRNRVPLSRPAIYRLIKQGKFPKPYDLGGGRAVAWSSEEIDAYIAARLDAGPASTVRPGLTISRQTRPYGLRRSPNDGRSDGHDARDRASPVGRHA